MLAWQTFRSRVDHGGVVTELPPSDRLQQVWCPSAPVGALYSLSRFDPNIKPYLTFVAKSRYGFTSRLKYFTLAPSVERGDVVTWCRVSGHL